MLGTIHRSMIACLAVAISTLISPAQAQTWPSRQITLVVPFAAGGPSDVIGRLTAEHVGRTLGAQIIVENVGGAGGTLGMDRVAKADPDGYTLLLHHSAFTAAPEPAGSIGRNWLYRADNLSDTLRRGIHVWSSRSSCGDSVQRAT